MNIDDVDLAIIAILVICVGVGTAAIIAGQVDKSLAFLTGGVTAIAALARGGKP